MKKIEDIKPPKKNVIKRKVLVPKDKSEIVDNDNGFTEELFYSPTEVKNRDLVYVKSSKKPKIFLGVSIVLLAFVGFFIFCSLKTKSNLALKIKQTEDIFSTLSSSVSNKDTFSIFADIQNVSSNMDGAMIDLQSVGQDIYVLDLIYPKNQASRISKLTNSVRVAHSLVFSFSNLINLPTEENNQTGTDWISQANSAIDVLESGNNILEQRVIYSSFVTDLFSPSLDFPLEDFDQKERQSIEKIRDLSKISVDFFHYFRSVPENVSKALAENKTKKSYLILFQNNAEIRPSGGFLGSFARVDFKDGKIEKIDFEKNIYTLDKAYLASGKAPEPPEEYKNFTDKLTMRDSNIYADFQESAKNVAWFYKEESGNDVDGVFAVDTSLFRQLLEITGPIEMSDYGLSINADNFLQDVQYQVEIGYFEDESNWSENQPKKILSDMLPIFMKKLFSEGEKSKSILSTIIQSIKEKHLLAYFTNEKLQDLATGINLAGKVANTSGDYIYLNDSNIGGKKSSLNIVQTLNHQVEIQSSGSVIEKLSVVKKHEGSYDWPDGTNKNYSSVFLPLTANVSAIKLISGSDQPDFNGQVEGPAKTSAQYGKTKVSFWQVTEPGKVGQTDIEYLRDKAINTNGEYFEYQMYIQKQPGVENLRYNLKLSYPDNWKPENVDNYDQNTHTIRLSYSIDKDTSFTIKFRHSGTPDLSE